MGTTCDLIRQDTNHTNEYDVTSLRQDQATTVRRVKTSVRDFSTVCQRSKKHRLEHVTSGFRRLSTSCREISSNTLQQLSFLFELRTRKDYETARVESTCCCNYHNAGSAIIPSIRQQTSTPISHFPASLATLFTIPNSKNLRFFVFIIFVLSLLVPSTFAISSSSEPLTRTDVTSDKKFKIFKGHGPQHHTVTRRSAHGASRPIDFQTLKLIPDWEGTRDVLLVSGRDFIYMINASVIPPGDDLKYTELLQWKSGSVLKNTCQTMGKSKFECNNFIRVMELQEDNKLYVCGTNSYRPKCRFYSRANFTTHRGNDESPFLQDNLCRRQCPCPFNPSKSSTTLYSNTSNGFQLFSASIDNFMANVPILMRSSEPPLYSMDKWFKDPTFIKLVDGKNGKIYLFFRETATSVETGRDATTYGRIAQVCKNDVGGTNVLEERWTSFLKARLKCAISGSANEASFAFDNLTAVSNVTTIVDGQGRSKDVVFATFTTPWNWKAVSMSAVCVYAIEDIENLFDTGRFLSERILHTEPSNLRGSYDSIVKAVPVSNWEVPNPRPGRCLKRTLTATDQTLHFAKEHFLMYDAVEPMYHEPIFISEKNVQATQIVLDSTVGNRELVAYVGTEDGKILRIRPNFQQLDAPKSLLLEEMKVAYPEDCASGRSPCGVLALNIYKPSSPDAEAALFVAFTDRLARVPLTRCSQYGTPTCCNVDPQCGWVTSGCLPRSSGKRNTAFPEIAPVRKISENCQVSESQCNITSLLNELCPDNPDNFDVSFSLPSSQHQSEPPQQNHGASSSVDLRSFTHDKKPSSQSGTTNNQPMTRVESNGQRRRCENMRDSKIPTIRDVDQEVAELFVKHILPSISAEFSDTIRAIPNKDRQAILLQQLRDSMVETALLVLRNHRMDHCLPSESVNSLTHSYPLLLREIETWHDLALKKMVPDKRWACWRSTSSSCMARVSFSLPLAPTLWAPLSNLIKDFGGRCDSLPTLDDQGSKSNGCSPPSGVLPCQDDRVANSSLCQIRKCRFTEFAVDVRAFFRHANDSRNFLKGQEPFEKVVEKKLKKDETLRAKLKLTVSRREQFIIYYNPMVEKVKITFHYTHVPDAAPRRPTTIPTTTTTTTTTTSTTTTVQAEPECNAKIENWLTLRFKNIVSTLSSKSKKCQRLIKRTRNEALERSGYPTRKKRSIYESNFAGVTHDKCYYVKKQFKFYPDPAWNRLVERALQNGGRYIEEHQTVVFTNKHELVQFFDQQCTNRPRWDTAFRNMRASVPKKRKTVEVEVSVSNDMPFLIEKLNTGKIQFKYFTVVIK